MNRLHWNGVFCYKASQIILWREFMRHKIIISAAAFLALAVSMPSSAVASVCSFKKTVHQSGTDFDITSRPAAGCAVQIVDISVRRGGKNFSRFRTDVDYLADQAWAADLDGDGRPELLLASKSTGSEAFGALDVYSLDGNKVRRTSMPQMHDPNGYRGGDRFRLDGRQIIRTVPFYKEGDALGSPSGGNRSFKYDFKDGKILFREQLDELTPVAKTPDEPTSLKPAVKSVPVRSADPGISAVVVTETGIEITSDNPIGKFKTMKLEKPERIAIDIPGASSVLAGRKLNMGKFGISKARIGLNKGFLRIVLDSTRSSFPKYTITATDTGLKIAFEGE